MTSNFSSSSSAGGSHPHRSHSASTHPIHSQPVPSLPVSALPIHGGDESVGTVAVRELASPIRVPDSKIRQVSVTDSESSIQDPSRDQQELTRDLAHEMAGPLAKVNDSIRRLRDGGYGELSEAQTKCLDRSITHCDTLEQMVRQLTGCDESGSTLSSIHRRWVSIDELKDVIDQALDPVSSGRGVRLLWDVALGRAIQTYVDPRVLRRLVVNLVNLGLQNSAPHRIVLVRCRPVGRQQRLQWSIVDEGRGIGETDLDLIAKGMTPSIYAGGPSLGISRRLAAALYSDLIIDSRLGLGTSVSFQTLCGGPADVAQGYAKWRCGYLSKFSTRSPISNDHLNRAAVKRTLMDPAMHPAGKVILIDNVHVDAPERTLRLKGPGPFEGLMDNASIVQVSLGATCASAAKAAFSGLLDQVTTASEFVYQTGREQWVLVLDGSGADTLRRMEAIESIAEQQIGGLRISWGESIVMGEVSGRPLDQWLCSRLADLLTRQVLNQKRYVLDDRDELFGCRPAPGPSIQVSMRLDKEVTWLTSVHQAMKQALAGC